MSEPLIFHIPGRATERAGAADVQPRRKSQRHRLLEQYNTPYAFINGLTDEEAGEEAGLSHTGFWKRCSELRTMEYIRPFKIAGKELTRPSKAGSRQMVCYITEAGLDFLHGRTS